MAHHHRRFNILLGSILYRRVRLQVAFAIPKENVWWLPRRRVQGTINNISLDGEVKLVSFGSPAFDRIEGCKTVPLTSMQYGQSLVLLALTEYLRMLL